MHTCAHMCVCSCTHVCLEKASGGCCCPALSSRSSLCLWVRVSYWAWSSLILASLVGSLCPLKSGFKHIQPAVLQVLWLQTQILVLRASVLPVGPSPQPHFSLLLFSFPILDNLKEHILISAAVANLKCQGIHFHSGYFSVGPFYRLCMWASRHVF